MASSRCRKLVELARMDLGLEPVHDEKVPNVLQTVELYSDICYGGGPLNSDVHIDSLIEQTCKPAAVSRTGEFQYKSTNIAGTSPEEDVHDNEKGFSSDDSVNDRDYVPEGNSTDSDDSSNFNIPLLLVKRKLLNSDGNEMCRQDKQSEKKRLVDGPYTRKKRHDRTEKRNAGKSYVTTKGKRVRKRKLKTLENCRTRCREKISEEVRQDIFNEYWNLKNRDKRVGYVADHSETTETAVKRKRTDNPAKSKNRQVSHSFYFKINGQKVKVCRGCFMKILDETQMFITLALNNSRVSLSGVIYTDKRGRHEPKNRYNQEKIQEVIDHINSFPAYRSHYTRRTNDKKYLSPNLTLQKMYEAYCENREEKVSRRIYETEFHKLKLAFKKPKVDTCHKCE